MNTMYCIKCGIRTNANYAEDLGTNGVYCARCATELRRLSSPPTTGSTVTRPLSRETRWNLNITNLAAGAYGDPKNPATLVRYWSDQADAGFPEAEENLKYFVKLAEKTRPKTVEDRVAEIKQVMELCEQVWKEHQQQEGEPTP